MISQPIKNLYWLAAAAPCLLNLYYQRAVYHRKNSGSLLLHLGSGDHYIDGFLNIEGNLFKKKDLWLDVRFGLPFPEHSARAVYLCHVLEHFDFQTGRKILGECRRVLALGGGIRIAVPSLDQAIDAFNRRDLAWFPEWPDRYESLGGRFNSYLLCRDQHRVMFDFSFAREVLHSAGFCSIETAGYGSSRVFSAAELERMEPGEMRSHLERSLVVEALREA
jgi:predicted SAM-dependent methyltransferase